MPGWNREEGMSNGVYDPKGSVWDLVEALGDDCHAYKDLLREFVCYLNDVQIIDFVETYKRLHDMDIPNELDND